MAACLLFDLFRKVVDTLRSCPHQVDCSFSKPLKGDGVAYKIFSLSDISTHHLKAYAQQPVKLTAKKIVLHLVRSTADKR